jgi:flagellar motility protein MotE (MotC chaperone)
MKKHEIDISPNLSVATSQDSTKMTGNTGWSWTTQKKIPKEINFTDATEFPSLKTTDTTVKSPTIDDESITNTTVIQQAIDTALKKAYDDHRTKELEAMQEAMQVKFNKQLQLIQQQNNMTSLEKKFDSLMEFLLKDNQKIERESPI